MGKVLTSSEMRGPVFSRSKGPLQSDQKKNIQTGNGLLITEETDGCRGHLTTSLGSQEPSVTRHPARSAVGVLTQ